MFVIGNSAAWTLKGRAVRLVLYIKVLDEAKTVMLFCFCY